MLKIKQIKSLTAILLFLIIGTFASAQEIVDSDTTKKIISSSQISEDFEADTIAIEESSPLDISNDRGLYLLAPDGNMQLRILGSIRLSAFYDMVEMPVKKNFNTYYIPTGETNIRQPNYYNTLNESRIGFEVKRKVGKRVVFGRLEMDFNGNNGQFRIRHAYGQIGSFLFGQTWSLFSNVSSMPATVDGNGPTGSVILRNPQIRYSTRINSNLEFAAAIEYSIPDLSTQEYDTLDLETIQLVPDLTARIKQSGDFGDIQLSVVVNTISIKDPFHNVTNLFGFGGSLSGVIDLPEGQNIKYQATYGKSIAHFITTFSGTGNDAVFSPSIGRYESLYSFGGFLSYGFDYNDRITSSVSLGYANVFNKVYQADEAYKNSLSLSFDAFWEIIRGARVGFEYAYGRKWNLDNSSGRASRFWMLFYYDF